MRMVKTKVKQLIPDGDDYLVEYEEEPEYRELIWTITIIDHDGEVHVYAAHSEKEAWRCHGDNMIEDEGYWIIKDIIVEGPFWAYPSEYEFWYD